MGDWFDKEREALDEQLDQGLISEYEHKQAVTDLRRERREVEADYLRDEAQDRRMRGI